MEETTMKPKIIFYGICLGVAAVLTVLTGCSSSRVPGIRRTPKATPVLTGGSIVVDRPEVFTFGRLIEQRQRDIELLQRKLNTYEPQGYQALRDVRIVRVKTEIAGEDKSAKEIAALQEEIAALKQQQAQATAAPKDAGESEKAASPQSAVPAEAAPTEAAQTVSEESTATAPSPSDFVRTEAELSPIEKVRDEMVYGKMLEAELLSIERDDSVALMGFVEYALKFDVAVIPGVNTQTLGEAALRMSWESSVSREFFRRWRFHFQKALEKEAFGIQRRWVTGNLTEKEKIDLQKAASQLRRKNRKTVIGDENKLTELTGRQELLNQDIADARESIAQLEEEIKKIDKQLADTPEKATTLITRKNLEGKKSGAQKRITDEEAKINQYQAEILTNEKIQRQTQDRIENGSRRIDSINRFASDLSSETDRLRDDTQRILCDIIQQRYLVFTEGLVTFLPHSRITINDNTAYFPQISQQPPERLESQQVKNFSQKISALKIEPYVAGIHPKQYVQNISDTTAREEAGSGKGSRAITIYQGVTRQPLAVGYTRGQNEFGWVLGPRLEVDPEGNVTERHLPVQYAFQVNIMVPAWSESIRLAGKYYWRNKDGSLGSGSDIWGGEIDVKLPGGPQAITWALMKDAAPLQPIILPPWEPGSDQDRFVVREGHKAILMIWGYELWRHPRVFLGAQSASSVDILPDGNGLLISFDSIQPPTMSSPRGNPLLDLTVITSRGRAVLKNAVEVLSQSKKGVEP
jgi:hypothetical protein